MVLDVKEVLHAAAAQPSEAMDVADVRRRARVVRRDRLVRQGIAGMAVAALVAVATVSVLDVRVFDVEFAQRPPREPAVDPDEEPGGGPPETWETLPPAPIVPRIEAAAVWTGREMIVWGGLDPARGHRPLGDGAAFEPAAGTWRAIAQAPLTPTAAPGAVWTGREVLVWGPTRGGAAAAAYDPAEGTWRTLTPPPRVNRGAVTVWTGREMIVWGGHHRDGTPANAGAAYDPARDRWRTVAPAPVAGRFRHGGVWTGREMIVWRGSVGDGAGAGYLADGAAYDPARDRWRLVATGPSGSREPAAALWTGKTMVVLGGVTGDNGRTSRAVASYNPSRDRWRRLPNLGLLGLTSFAWAGDQIVGWGTQAAHPVALNPRNAISLALPAAPGRLGVDAAAVWTGKQLIIWGGHDGNEVPVDDGAVLNTAAYPPLRNYAPPPPPGKAGPRPPADGPGG